MAWFHAGPPTGDCQHPGIDHNVLVTVVVYEAGVAALECGALTAEPEVLNSPHCIDLR